MQDEAQSIAAQKKLLTEIILKVNPLESHHIIRTLVLLLLISSPILQMESDPPCPGLTFPLRCSSKLPNSGFSADDVRSFSAVLLLVNFLGSNMSIIEKEIRWPDVVFIPDSWYSSILQIPVVFLIFLYSVTKQAHKVDAASRRIGGASVRCQWMKVCLSSLTGPLEETREHERLTGSLSIGWEQSVLKPALISINTI